MKKNKRLLVSNDEIHETPIVIVVVIVEVFLSEKYTERFDSTHAFRQLARSSGCLQFAVEGDYSSEDCDIVCFVASCRETPRCVRRQKGTHRIDPKTCINAGALFRDFC